jgi:hypothetical protein
MRLLLLPECPRRVISGDGQCRNHASQGEANIDQVAQRWGELAYVGDNGCGAKAKPAVPARGLLLVVLCNDRELGATIKPVAAWRDVDHAI